MDFNELKRNRSNSLESLQRELEEVSGKKSKKSYRDERFWEPTVDKMKNGSALLRFIPDPNGLNFVKVYSHTFKGPSGRWYIENCRSTINEKDPVLDYNQPFWDRGEGALVRSQSRKTHFYSNVKVVKDSLAPENEGKVFLFKYGLKIFEKINNLSYPPFDDEGRAKGSDGYNPTNAMDPFSMWEGANFRLLIQSENNMRNYDMSNFDMKSSMGNDEEIEETWKQGIDVTEFTNPENFKSYSDLQKRLYDTLGLQMDAIGSKPVTAEAKMDSIEKKAAPEIPVAGMDDDDLDLDKLMDELG